MGNRGPVFFEEWAFLARVDSALFESRRRKAIQDVLDLATSDQQRTAGANLQREIDRVIEQASTPETALMQIAKMMHAHLEYLLENLAITRESLSALQQAMDPDNPVHSTRRFGETPEGAQ